MANGANQMLDPLELYLLVFKIQKSAFIWRKHYLNRVKKAPFALAHFSRHIFDKSANEGVHDSVRLSIFDILFVSIAVQLVTC